MTRIHRLIDSDTRGVVEFNVCRVVVGDVGDVGQIGAQIIGRVTSSGRRISQIRSNRGVVVQDNKLTRSQRQIPGTELGHVILVKRQRDIVESHIKIRVTSVGHREAIRHLRTRNTRHRIGRVRSAISTRVVTRIHRLIDSDTRVLDADGCHVDTQQRARTDEYVFVPSDLIIVRIARASRRVDVNESVERKGQTAIGKERPKNPCQFCGRRSRVGRSDWTDSGGAGNIRKVGIERVDEREIFSVCITIVGERDRVRDRVARFNRLGCNSFNHTQVGDGTHVGRPDAVDRRCLVGIHRGGVDEDVFLRVWRRPDQAEQSSLTGRKRCHSRPGVRIGANVVGACAGWGVGDPRRRRDGGAIDIARAVMMLSRGVGEVLIMDVGQHHVGESLIGDIGDNNVVSNVFTFTRVARTRFLKGDTSVSGAGSRFEVAPRVILAVLEGSRIAAEHLSIDWMTHTFVKGGQDPHADLDVLDLTNLKATNRPAHCVGGRRKWRRLAQRNTRRSRRILRLEWCAGLVVGREPRTGRRPGIGDTLPRPNLAGVVVSVERVGSGDSRPDQIRRSSPSLVRVQRRCIRTWRCGWDIAALSTPRVSHVRIPQIVGAAARGASRCTDDVSNFVARGWVGLVAVAQ